MEDDQKITHEQAKKLIVPIDVKGVRARLVKVLEDPAHAEYIRELLRRVSATALVGNELVEGGDVLKIFDLIQKQRGMIRAGEPGSHVANTGGNFALGTIAGGDAGIQIGSVVPGETVTFGELKRRYLKSDTAYALHETLHHAGSHLYSDQDFAMAVHTLPGRPSLPKEPHIAAFSRYWDDDLREVCNL